ncbi:MAG: HAD family hydrolase [Candidatus Micrarchaeota archaeon]
MKKTISFDLDGTLADLNFEKAVWLEEIPRLFAEKNRLGLETAKKAVFSAYEYVGNKDAKWYDIKFWLGELGLDRDYNKILRRSSHLIRLYPDTIPALEKLRKKYRLIVISNATREFIDFKLRVEHLEKYFDAVFSTTTDFKCIKGDSKGYLEVCRKMKIKPSDLIHIGDDYEFDYIAARKVGIEAYFLDRSCKGGKGKVVNNLLEFSNRVNEK